jgi:hypothetical protein
MYTHSCVIYQKVETLSIQQFCHCGMASGHTSRIIYRECNALNTKLFQVCDLLQGAPCCEDPQSTPVKLNRESMANPSGRAAVMMLEQHCNR